jgi:hypothetical protein
MSVLWTHLNLQFLLKLKFRILKMQEYAKKV